MNARKHESHMSNDKRLTILETTILHINDSLMDIKHELRRQSDRMDRMENRMETRFDAIDKKFDAVDKKFESLENKFESKFDAINNRLWSNFMWLTSMMVGLAGLIAHTQHWI